jgi:hypothetical protein
MWWCRNIHKKDINHKILNEISTLKEGEFESLFVEIKCNQKQYIVGEIYRPPNTNEKNSLDYYENTLNNQIRCNSWIGI